MNGLVNLRQKEREIENNRGTENTANRESVSVFFGTVKSRPSVSVDSSLIVQALRALLSFVELYNRAINKHDRG